MATSGAYKNSAYTFNFSFTKASDPTAFFTGTFLTSEVKVVTRDGGTTNAAVNIASAPSHEGNGVYEINLTASEMNHDEIMIVLVPSSADVVPESISIVTEPTPSDVLEVQKTAVTVADFKADVSALATSASISALNDFNPATDTVANVTTVGSVSGSVGSVVASVTAGTVTDKTGYFISGTLTTLDALDTQQDVQHSTTQSAIGALNDFDPASDVVASVTTVSSVSGSVTVGSIAANAVNASSLAADAVTEIQSGLATASAQSTAQADLDVITGTDGVTLASSQANYAPATASALSSVSANVDAVLTDTGTTLPGTLATISGKIDTVDAICDQVLNDTSTGVAISTAQAQALADEVLKRSVSNVESGAAEHTLATIVLAILESSRAAEVWTIKRTDGLTTHKSKVLTLDDTAKPVVGVN